MSKPFYYNLFIFFITLLFWSAPTLSSDDAYLDALEAEAKSGDQSSPSTEKPIKTSLPSSDPEQQMKEYSMLLKSNYPATYNAYVKLDHEDKVSVVNSYFEHDKNPVKASSLLFNLYFDSKRKKRENNESN